MKTNIEQSTPLVTIAVITYNTAKYVVETLDSVKHQTYQNIELIVSDDGSTDDSVKKCKEWVAANGARFIRTEVIEGKNIGVAGNTNRALYVAKGEWFKDLSGDDILPDDAVEKHMNYVRNHPDIRYFFGKEIFFYGDFKDKNFMPKEMPFRHVFFGEEVTAQRQFKLLTRQFFGAATASFGNTKTIKSIGGYNEAIPMTEDGPLYLALTKAGYKLGFMDEYSIYRRIHSKSYTHVVNENAILTDAQIRNFKQYSFWDLQAENSNWFWKKMYCYYNYLWAKVIDNGNNKYSFKCRYFDFLRRYINPYKYNLIILYLEEFLLNILNKNH